MKKTYLISCILIILVSLVCLPSCQRCGTNYIPVDSRILASVGKVGSYFIYEDSVDQIIDSEYVYQYSFSAENYITSQGQCSYYADNLEMYESSFRNGFSYNDTIVWALSDVSYIISVDDHKWFFTSGDNVPALNLHLDTTISNYTIAGITYPIVYKGSPPAQIGTGSSAVHIDIYFSPGYGIVQRVEHRPTGDVSWNLIRYHIVQ